MRQFKTAITGIAHPLIQRAWWSDLLWVPAAALLGFTIPAVFAGILHLPRNLYLIPYVGLVSLFFYLFVRRSGFSIINLLRRNLIWGIVGAVLLGVFTVGNILSQPASGRAEGLPLVFDVLWIGVVYGMIDALLLSVLPVLVIWQAFSARGWTTRWPRKILVGFIAILVSLLVTAVYHFGYPECRTPRGLFEPTLGNGAMTLGYVLTGNPISAIFSHIAMHVAAVLHGPDSVLQLPPHY